jgi:hypothetical protein
MTASLARLGSATWVLVAMLALTACTTATTVRQHEDFAGRRTRIARVAVVPPEVDATLIVFKGTNEPLPEEVTRVSAVLPELLKRGLEEHGFVVALPVAEDGMESELRAMIAQLRQTTAQVNADMYESVALDTSKAMKYSASVGPQVAELADALDADALLLASYAEFHKSSGETARDVTIAVLVGAATLGNFIPIPVKYGASLVVMLVDGVTGELLWSNVAARGELVESPIDPLVAEIFQPMAVQAAPTPAPADDAAPPAEPNTPVP